MAPPLPAVLMASFLMEIWYFFFCSDVVDYSLIKLGAWLFQLMFGGLFSFLFLVVLESKCSKGYIVKYNGIL